MSNGIEHKGRFGDIRRKARTDKIVLQEKRLARTALGAPIFREDEAGHLRYVYSDGGIDQSSSVDPSMITIPPDASVAEEHNQAKALSQLADPK